MPTWDTMANNGAGNPSNVQVIIDPFLFDLLLEHQQWNSPCFHFANTILYLRSAQIGNKGMHVDSWIPNQ